MKKKNKKQKLKIPFKLVFMVAALVLVVSGGWKLTNSEPDTVLQIENVRIEGGFVNLRPNVLRQTVVGVLHGSYFTVDLDVIRNVLLELPWVEEVTVRRQWPLSLRIKVLEKKAIAYWGKESLISDRGVVFTPEKINRSQVLPELSGPGELHNKVVQFYSEVSKKLSLAGFDVDRLSLDVRRAWRMEVSKDGSLNRVDIRLGRTDVNLRLERFIKVFSMREMHEVKNIRAIDLRYPNGFAMFRNDKHRNNTKAKTTTLETEV